MRKGLSAYTFLFPIILFGQIGINTSTPHATLDIVAKNNSGNSSEGVIAPRLAGDILQTAATNAVYGTSQDGAIVYVTAPTATLTGQTTNVDAKGYYYYDSSKNQWIKMFFTMPAVNNGITLGGSNIGLGGALSKFTQIDLNNFNLAFSGNGNFGLGTTAPTAKLHLVNGTGKIDNYSATVWPSLSLRRARGTESALAATQSGDILGTLYFQGYSNAFASGLSAVQSKAVENFTATANGSNLEFYTTPSGTTSLLMGMLINHNGNVGIGNASPQSKLYVAQDLAAYPNSLGVAGAQFNVGGSTNTNKVLQLGYNTTDNVGFIQSATHGTAYTPILINPFGGSVGIGTGGATPNNNLEINSGTSGVSGLRLTRINNSTATTSNNVALLGVNPNGDVVVASSGASATSFTATLTTTGGQVTPSNNSGANSGYSPNYGTLTWQNMITNTGAFSGGTTFTAPTSGFYLASLTITLTWDGTGGSGIAYGRIYCSNGQSYFCATQGSDGMGGGVNNELASMTTSPVIYLTPGQTLQAQVYVARTGSNPPKLIGEDCTFSVAKLN